MIPHSREKTGGNSIMKTQFGIVLDQHTAIGTDGEKHTIALWQGSLAVPGDIAILIPFENNYYTAKRLNTDPRAIGLATLDQLEELYEKNI